MYWLLEYKSKLSTNNKLLLYKTIWTYGIQLWGTASTSNIEILEDLAHDSRHTFVRAKYGYPKGSPNTTVKEEIQRYSSQYSARLSAHPNELIANLMELPDNRRLQRHMPNDLPARFLV
jgi:hypothetical protein